MPLCLRFSPSVCPPLSSCCQAAVMSCLTFPRNLAVQPPRLGYSKMQHQCHWEPVRIMATPQVY